MTTLSLVDEATGAVLTFPDLAQPQALDIANTQQLAVHDLIGGGRVVEALGRKMTPVSWEGVFLGAPMAFDAGLALQALAASGGSTLLTWERFRFRGLISALSLSCESAFRISYKITFTPSDDLSAPLKAQDQTVSLVGIASTLDAVQALAMSLGDLQLGAQLERAVQSLTQIASLTGASQGQILAVLQPANLALSRTAVLLAGTDVGLGSDSQLGGAADLQQRTAAALNSAALVSVRNGLSQVIAQLGDLTSGSPVLTVAGGDLMQIATQTYGSALDWTTLAQANGLTDPSLTGLNTLVIPALSSGSDGVLQV